ncbi:hypothetical protein BAL199_10942 [alpha proteobacterium BAL199]|jgi:hypothetical protein|nr:hypothetical protein BAL199_10942 [alpha proteobacterium BAL199]
MELIVARRDGKARMPWSVKGVSSEARELAKTATARESETMGEWLSDIIRRVGAAEAAGRPLSLPHRRTTLALPGRVPARGSRVEPYLNPQVPEAPAESEPDPETVDEAALAALVAERVERTETRLVGLLESLEDIVVRLAGRLDRLERAIEEPAATDEDQRSLPSS